MTEHSNIAPDATDRRGSRRRQPETGTERRPGEVNRDRGRRRRRDHASDAKTVARQPLSPSQPAEPDQGVSRSADRRGGRASAAAAFITTLPVVLAGAAITVYLVWVCLQMAPYATGGVGLLAGIVAAIAAGCIATVAGLVLGRRL